MVDSIEITKDLEREISFLRKEIKMLKESRQALVEQEQRTRIELNNLRELLRKRGIYHFQF